MTMMTTMISISVKPRCDFVDVRASVNDIMKDSLGDCLLPTHHSLLQEEGQEDSEYIGKFAGSLHEQPPHSATSGEHGLLEVWHRSVNWYRS